MLTGVSPRTWDRSPRTEEESICDRQHRIVCGVEPCFLAGDVLRPGGRHFYLFAAAGAGSKAQGDLMEAANYTLTAQQAGREKQYTEMSTGIQLPY
jgi:hypothetical protein